MMEDPYQVLGLERGASDEEVKKAYRRLAGRYLYEAVRQPGRRKVQPCEAL